jgi:hypothetical protein
MTMKARDFFRAFFLVPSNNFTGLLRRRLSLKNEKPSSQEKIRSVETSSDARKLSGGKSTGAGHRHPDAHSALRHAAAEPSLHRRHPLETEAFKNLLLRRSFTAAMPRADEGGHTAPRALVHEPRDNFANRLAPTLQSP